MEYQLTQSELKQILEIGKDKIIHDFGSILAFNFNDDNPEIAQGYIEDIFHSLETDILNK